MAFVKNFVKLGVCGLSKSYYWRTFIWGAVPMIIILGICGLMVNDSPKNMDALLGKDPTASIAMLIMMLIVVIVALLCYPFAKYVWDSIMEYLFPIENRPTIIIFSKTFLWIFLWVLVIRYFILLGFAVYIAPFVWIYLYRQNKKLVAFEDANSF